MAIYTTVNNSANLVLSWNQTDVDSVNTQDSVSDIGYYQNNPSWASGTGTGLAVNSGLAPQIKIFHNQQTLTANGQAIYNTVALTRTVFSGNFTVSFTGIQALYVENLNTPNYGMSLGATITVCATGASGFSGLFNGSGNHIVTPGSVLFLTNYWSGFPCSGNANTLFINDAGGSGATYRIALLGF